jgi:nucleoside-diphosphate-sugar epimerase
MPIKVAVTGPNGWIARTLLSALKIDTYTSVAIQRDWLYKVNGAAHPALLSALHGCDSIVHLAALVHQMNTAPTLADYRKVNCDLTLELAQSAASVGVRQFIFVSTAKVMGEFSTRPFTENDIPKPTDDYAISKLEAEVGLRNLQLAGKLGAMKIVVVRPPLVYGEGAGANYAKLIALANSKWPLPLGCATALRSMVSVDRLVTAILVLILLGDEFSALDTFFATDPEDHSAASIVSAIRTSRQRRAGLVRVPMTTMQICFSKLGKQGIYDRLFTSFQLDGSKLDKVIGEVGGVSDQSKHS